jgi:Uma2 family endonuclease
VATVTDSNSPETFEEFHERIGQVPLRRIRMRPAPGMATEQDVIALLEAPNKRLCELVDGVLVDKDMSVEASLLGGLLVHILWAFVEPRKLGWVFPADSATRLFPGLVRIPDVSFLCRNRAPGGKRPSGPLLGVVPDLAVEVLSPGNTPGEMKRKLRDYFLAGISLVWIIDPTKENAEVHTAPDKKRRIARHQALTGKDILPGFTLTLKELFDRAE